jgi:hypothetical protein
MATPVKKTTLAESPEATSRLTEIKPNEVSMVDMPANGEPFVVVKRGGTMSKKVEKLDTSVVPRPVMKAIDSRLKGVRSMVGEIVDVAKSLPVSKDGNNENAPAPLVFLVKSTAAELRSLQSPTSVKVNKRGSAESVLAIQDLVKRAEELEEVKKGNAVSYLMRDQYVDITTSVTEWLTTYVDGVEHDDAGPVLIPIELNEGIDEAASSLEKLADDYPASESDDDDKNEPDAEAEVSKLLGEIQTLKSKLQSSTSEIEVGKKGSKMAAERLKALKSVSSGVSEASDQLSQIVKELEDDPEEEGGDMATEGTEETTPEETTKNAPQSNEPTEAPADTQTEGTQKNVNGDSVTNEQLMAALTKFAQDSDARFEKIEGEIAKANETATKASEEVEKIHRARGDSRGGESDSTTKVSKNAGGENPASFHGLLGIPEGK